MRGIKSLTIKKKIIASFLILTLIIVIANLTSFGSIKSVEGILNQVVGKSAPSINAIGNLISNTLVVNRVLVGATQEQELSGLESVAKNYQTEKQNIANLYVTLEELNKTNPDMLTQIANYKQQSDQILQNGEILITDTNSVIKKRSLIDNLMNDFDDDYDSVQEQLKDQIDSIEGNIQGVSILITMKNAIRDLYDIILTTYNTEKIPAAAQNLDNLIADVEAAVAQIEDEEIIDAFDFANAKDSVELILEAMTADYEIKVNLETYIRLLENMDNKISQLNTDVDVLKTNLESWKTSTSEMFNNNTEQEVATSINSSINNLIVTFLLSLLVQILAGIFLVVSIGNPLKLTTSIMRKLSKGDLTTTIDYSTKDEFKVLIDAVSNHINTLHDSIKDISNSSTTLYKSASMNREKSIESQNTITKQRDKILSTSAAMHQTSCSGEGIARSAEEMVQELNNTKDKAESGSHEITSSLNKTQELSKQVSETHDLIMNLASKTNEITGIVAVVNNIAEQTNLLALNAAIEAARAGDQGRGFAVVATEVRVLAEKTKDSTQQLMK